MALGWFTFLKNVPWDRVAGLAPKVAEGGAKVWSMVANRKAAKPAAEPPPQSQPAGPEEAAAALEIRVQSLDKRLGELREEAASSFEVVRALTEQVRTLGEQHAVLVKAVDALIARSRLLLWTCVALGVAVLALLAWVLAR